MVSAPDIAQALGKSVNGVLSTTGRWIVSDRADGAAETAMTSSTTFYYSFGIAPFACRLKEATVRAKAVGKPSSTIDIVKAASGTAIASGTAMVTQIAGDTGLTANTNIKCTVNTDGSVNLAAGDTVGVKIVTQGTETLTPPQFLLVFE